MLSGNPVRYLEASSLPSKTFGLAHINIFAAWTPRASISVDSGLGPLLFVLYAQPIADIIRSFGLDYHIYADDTQIYVSFNPKSPADIFRITDKVNKCVSALKKWMTSRWLKFNDTKTEVIVVSTPNQMKQHPIASMQVGASTITPTSSVRNLGVQFDSVLNLEEHVSNICKNAYFQIHSIGCIKKCLSTESAKTITHALVISRLDYSFNGHGPQYIRDMIEPYVPSRSLGSDSQKLLTVPKFRLSTFGGRSFEYNAALLWNQTPIDIRSSPTLQTFKSRLKTYYFQICFDS
eukprot:gene1036-363_t